MGDYYCSGSLDEHVVLGIFVASLRAVGCATTLASAGLWLARQGMMTPALSKGLSQLSVKLAIPCLLFSSVVPGVSPHVLSYGWPLLLLPAVHLLLGMLVGCLTVLIVKPPDKLTEAQTITEALQHILVGGIGPQDVFSFDYCTAYIPDCPHTPCGRWCLL